MNISNKVPIDNTRLSAFSRQENESVIHHRNLALVNAIQIFKANESNPTKIPAFLQRLGIATMSLLTVAQVSAEEPKNPTTATKEPTAKVEQQTTPLEAYKLKVDKMSEKELRAESKALRAEIQPLVDSGAEESVLRPLLLKFKIVDDRLRPIIKANIARNKQITAENKQITAESKKASVELDRASSLFDDCKKQLLNPETIDEEKFIKQLKEARRIHKKYSPELYVTKKSKQNVQNKE